MPEAARYYGQSLKDDPGNAELLSLAFFYSTTSGDMEARRQICRPGGGQARRTTAPRGWRWRWSPSSTRIMPRRASNLSLSAKGPFTVLTVSLFDAWARGGQGDAAGAHADMKTLAAQSGAEGSPLFMPR